MPIKALAIPEVGPDKILCIESYGVRISIESDDPKAIGACRKVIDEALPQCHAVVPNTPDAKTRFRLDWNDNGSASLYEDGEPVAVSASHNTVLNILATRVRLTVAEFAVGRVFIHAGAVSWKGKAILIPGKSFSGKTSLTAELVKRGAGYFSDEYAVLDFEGLVHPFPKTLSIRHRIDDATQSEYSVGELGGTFASEKTPVGMILITEYKPNAEWNPQLLSPAHGVMEMIKNSVSIRTSPTSVLGVLDQIANSSVVVKTPRGDATACAESIFDFYETNCF
jgi:hypothetical protein